MLTIEISDKDDTITICNGKQKVVLSIDDALELYQEIGYHFFTTRWEKARPEHNPTQGIEK